jgi:hypothetical protein
MDKKTDFYGVVAQAKDIVPGFKEGYKKFEQQVALKGLSKGLLTNYGRNTAHLALNFGRCPEYIYLYLHIAQVLPKSAKSPLDTLYSF